MFPSYRKTSAQERALRKRWGLAGRVRGGKPLSAAAPPMKRGNGRTGGAASVLIHSLTLRLSVWISVLPVRVPPKSSVQFISVKRSCLLRPRPQSGMGGRSRRCVVVGPSSCTCNRTGCFRTKTEAALTGVSQPAPSQTPPSSPLRAFWAPPLSRGSGRSDPFTAGYERFGVCRSQDCPCRLSLHREAGNSAFLMASGNPDGSGRRRPRVGWLGFCSSQSETWGRRRSAREERVDELQLAERPD
ncbi:hypothetical protein FQA47_005956 [Oryzias melastigma]|uniref:Uncharacterized protein n=1 Tax=Oryzias melastigma TaxID=30732 RepID=A0A834CGS8_ORYME|nr:hypothetical protein FQA47_005956 [Oryzias melastigma]